ncbi:hypothetical protein Q8G35_10960 [Peribacillus simplex]|uniref:Uncharacterized protein n=2 Tax=Peribacillus TaxID=2675229 RepID=A0AA90PBW2_9BACI|nr:MULTISPECIES: hypothetical protein [Peribacillus]MDP1418933.1 hypothetical protein [Peribacillus simplex]MDP1451626.1 hypothetical protein [Peribacillus frigoritolerans]
MMNIHDKAYESYLKICERYGIESINFDHFIKNLTKDQLDEYSKLAV